MAIRGPYEPRARVQIETPGPARTKQSFKAECDINRIMAKYQKTGAVDHLAKHGPRYGFVPAIVYQDAMNVVAEANTMFEELPSSLRSRFQNDPAAFLDFVQDEKNLPEMRELGLARPGPVRASQEAEGDGGAVEGPQDPSA